MTSVTLLMNKTRSERRNTTQTFTSPFSLWKNKILETKRNKILPLPPPPKRQHETWKREYRLQITKVFVFRSYFVRDKFSTTRLICFDDQPSLSGLAETVPIKNINHRVHIGSLCLYARARYKTNPRPLGPSLKQGTHIFIHTFLSTYFYPHIFIPT